MLENNFFKNAINRFKEIKNIDELNWTLLVFLTLSFAYMGYATQHDLLGAFFGVTWAFIFRIVFLPYYFFGKFTNSRFNVITVILLFIALYTSYLA